MRLFGDFLYCSKKHYLVLSIFLFTFLALPALSQGTPQTASVPASQASAPKVKLLYFGEDMFNPTDSGNRALLCVVSNEGDASIPANSLQLRCLALSGLDYTSGDITPMLPALAPHQIVVYRWQLAPNGEGPMLAAAVLQSASVPPGNVPPVLQIASTALPALSEPPHFGPPLPTQKWPAAGIGAQGAWLGANRIGLRCLRTSDGRPLLLVSTFTGASSASEGVSDRNSAAWQMVGILWPLAKVCSAEDTTIEPWWHTFYWQSTRVFNTKTSATLTLIGSLGRLWRAEISFTVRPNTTAILGNLKLVAQTNLRLRAVQLPQLLFPNTTPPPPANGTPLVLAQADPSSIDGASCLTAYHFGMVTAGIIASTTPPLPNWQWACAQGNAADCSILVPSWQTNGDDPLIMAHASLSIPFRLFALAPSLTINDALRFQAP